MYTPIMSSLAESRNIVLPYGNHGRAIAGLGLIRLVGVLVVPTKGAAAV